MPRTLRLGLYSAVLVAALTAAGLVLTTREGSAQQTPPGEELQECCHAMTPGGRTIGGPAVEVLQTHTQGGAFQTSLFESSQPISMCVTLTNLNDPIADSGHMLLFVESEFTIVPIPGVPPDARVVHPGRTGVRCGQDTKVGVTCLASNGQCRYRWRIDLALEGPGVSVTTPR